MKESINWGIIGLGKIAQKFVSDLALVDGSKLQAVGSRGLDKARDFATKNRAKEAYGSYEELVQDSKIDVVYIATPHVYHAELTHLCLDHGKSVLCEKPFAMNIDEVRGMIEKAKNKNLFLMEALWTRFIPATEKLLELIGKGTIGELRSIHADFGFKAEYDPTKRLFNKSLGGGALLDIGIYPLYMAQLILGSPDSVNANAHFGATGVDHSLGILLGYENDKQAVLHATLSSTTQTAAWIHGSEGSIYMHPRFHHCARLSVYKEHQEIESFEIPYIGSGYYHEIEAVNHSLYEGQIQNPKMSWDDSLKLIELLDRVRDQVGLHYG
jgi:predicted dehydrogenase